MLFISILVIAILTSVVAMLLSAQPIGEFVDRKPNIKILALSFLLVTGFTLVAEGFDVHLPKGYIYFAMFFSVSVELLNMRMRNKRESVPLLLTKKITECETA